MKLIAVLNETGRDKIKEIFYSSNASHLNFYAHNANGTAAQYTRGDTGGILLASHLQILLHLCLFLVCFVDKNNSMPATTIKNSADFIKDNPNRHNSKFKGNSSQLMMLYTCFICGVNKTFLSFFLHFIIN